MAFQLGSRKYTVALIASAVGMGILWYFGERSWHETIFAGVVILGAVFVLVVSRYVFMQIDPELEKRISGLSDEEIERLLIEEGLSDDKARASAKLLLKRRRG